jgi:ferrous iron transport protein B
MRPLGIPCEGTVALVAGVGAKEVTVSTLGVLYADNDENAGQAETSLPEKLAKPTPETGNSDWTPLAALSFMIFALLYFPCLAALAAISKEAGGMKWVVLSVVYNTVMAWLVAFAVHSIGNLFV